MDFKNKYFKYKKKYLNLKKKSFSQQGGDKIEKRRSLIGKIVVIKRSNGKEGLWKIDNKVYSHGNRKENDSLWAENLEGFSKWIKIYDEDFDKIILRLATPNEIETYESLVKAQEDLWKSEDKKIFDKFAIEIYYATDLDTLNKIERRKIVGQIFNYKSTHKSIYDLLEKRKNEIEMGIGAL
jgi:hypothetical protein